jgi:site-specific DNA recombinase
VHAPTEHQTIDAKSRDNLLQAIARARGWMDSIIAGKIASFDDIAAAENLAERYVRRLAVLALLSPKIVRAIAEGTAPADLTISRLTQALPHRWSAQEQMFGFR